MNKTMIERYVGVVTAVAVKKNIKTHTIN